MGGGDLNLKKSWHTQTLQNIEKVWKVEQQAEEERRKTEILKKEKEKERQLEELQRTYEDAGFKKRVERLDWMYQGPAGQARDLNEEYLLGKRRVDDKLDQGTINMNEVAVAAPEVSAGLSQRELMMKLREDPLLIIRKKEVQVVEETLQNPLKLKQIREARHRLENHDDDDGMSSDNKRRKADDNKEPSDGHSVHDHQGYLGSSKSRNREHERRNRSRSRSPSTRRNFERSHSRHHRHERDPTHREYRRRETTNASYSGKEEIDEKLRAMREDAEWNEQQRSERLRQREEHDKRISEEEEVVRKSTEGRLENATFIEKLHRQAYGSYATDSIGDRIKRNIHYVQKGVTSATSHSFDDRHG